jgi:hypothetical protein
LGTRTTVVAVAFMTHGRWVALCPRTGCMNAESFGRCDDGTIGGLSGDHFECRTEGWTSDGRRTVYGGCGLICGVEWPANIRDLERVLHARPIPVSRNWTPGEDLHNLVNENMAHGIMPEASYAAIVEGAPSGTSLELRNGEVVEGDLKFTEPPPALEA